MGQAVSGDQTALEVTDSWCLFEVPIWILLRINVEGVAPLTDILADL